MATLQKVIERLTGFWHEHGCAVIPPCSFEVPLGLLHPETFVRLLDEEPWQVAYLQPISRPADGRGGRHPFRTARHLQLQVVLGDVSPRAPRELMVASLESTGFVLDKHDLRFNDHRLNIEAAAITGHGWQVALDGLRLGRISFLDSVAGERPRRPTVEISYGVERLAMARTGAEDVFSVPWQAASQTAGGRRKRLEAEEESFSYAVDVASADYLRRTVGGLEQEARRCLEAGLPRTAYELAIRMLPALDQLETRGELSGRERQKGLGDVRSLVVAAATLYRRQLPGGEPEVAESKPESSEVSETAEDAESRSAKPKRKSQRRGRATKKAG